MTARSQSILMAMIEVSELDQLAVELEAALVLQQGEMSVVDLVVLKMEVDLIDSTKVEGLMDSTREVDSQVVWAQR